MAGAQRQQNLFVQSDSSADTVVVNDRCVIRTEQGNRIVVVSGIVLAQYDVADGLAESYAMVSLVEQGWASQRQVARAFGCSVRTVRRQQLRFSEGGLTALGRQAGYPAGRRRVTHSRLQMVRRLKTEGVANREVARQLGVTPKAVRKLLKRMGWHDREPEQIRLPLGPLGGGPKPVPFSIRAASRNVGKAVPRRGPKPVLFCDRGSRTGSGVVRRGSFRPAYGSGPGLSRTLG